LNPSFVKKWRPITAIFPLVCFGVILSYPLIYTWRELNAGTYAYESNLRYYPYATFADELKYEPDMKLFISKSIVDKYPWNGPSPFKYGMPGLGISEILYDAYFNIEVNQDQLEIGPISGYFMNYPKYSYALLTVADWSSVSDPTKQQIENTHMIKPDPNGIIVLVVSNDSKKQ
jgi:hypothetical protein